MDPKGTYYSPQEAGFATVLKPGPNFLALSQQEQALRARRDALRQAAEEKRIAERDRQINGIVEDMSKPVPTAYIYQNTVNEMKTSNLNRLKDMFKNNEDLSKVKFEAANMVQDIVSYADSAKQVYMELGASVKSLGKQYKKDVVLKSAVSKLVGDDGKMLDPRTLSTDTTNVQDMIFSSEKPWEFLDETVVVKNFLNNDMFKSVSMDIQRKIDTGELGRFYEVGTTTNKTTAPGKIFEIDPYGKPKISDPDTLIKNGVFNVMLNDREMLSIVDKYATELMADRAVKPTDEQMDMVRAEVLRDLLVERTPGPSTVERINTRYMPKYASSGTTSEQKQYAGGERFVKSFKSGNPSLLKDAIAFAMSGDSAQEVLPPGIIGGDEKLEALSSSVDGKSFVASIVKLNSDGTVKTKGGLPALRLQKFDVEDIDEGVLRTVHARAAAKNKRAYGTSETGTPLMSEEPTFQGSQTTQGQPVYEPGFLNKKRK